MNNELFDRMIKEGLSNAQVTPSSGLKKAIGRKLFFQNLMVFHKVKIVVAALLIGTSSFLSYSYLSEENNRVVPETAMSGKIVTDEILSTNQKTTEVKETVETPENLISFTSDNVVAEKTNTDNVSDMSIDNSKKQIANENFATNNLKDNNNDTPKKVSDKSEKNQNFSADDSQLSSTDNNPSTKKENALSNGFNESSVTEDAGSLVNEQLFLAEAKGVNFPALSYLPLTVKEEDLSLKKKHILRSELSFDVYKHIMNENDIDNQLVSEEHQKYYWDFYKENEGIKTNSLGGFDINYALGTKTLKGKVSTGINLSKIVEEKSHYEFDELIDPVWLEHFNVEELAWVNTYGEDTCIQCFSAHNTEELQTELKKDKNEYSYVNIPLKIGAELNLKYISLDVMGGVQLSHLTKATGLYVANNMLIDPRFYFWDHLSLTTLSQDNVMLKKNYFSWLANANLRVRVARQIDLLAGYNMSISKGNITKNHYILDKSLKYSQVKVGLTFYPNRLPIRK